MKLRALAFFGFAAIASVACVAPTEAGEEVGTDEAAYDTFRAPTQHGELELGLESGGTFTADERFHAFDFEIQSNSNVRLYTAPAANKGPLVDTVIYLYRQGPAGFGASIASSDNARSTAWSEIRRTLSPGSYRLLVKGKTTSTRGAFRVAFECPECLGTSSCVFGPSFYNVRRGRTVTVEKERAIDHASQLSALEKKQVVNALHASAHTDVTTATQALARVDGNEINLLHLWDPSNAKAYLAVEYGAGDNSYGRIYAPGSAVPVATIQDGDITGCALPKGVLGTDCAASASCGPGATCQGISETLGLGKCAAIMEQPGEGNACSAQTSCPTGGLICAGLVAGQDGLCLRASMAGTFSDWKGVNIPDNAPKGASRYIDVYGLATVSMDVSMTAVVRHPSAGQLKLTLTNPAGTEAVVFDGTSTGKDLHIDMPVQGFPGDESVNGRWTLKLVDKKTGSSGMLERWTLSLTSRWD
jgi:hypothetical protein